MTIRELLRWADTALPGETIVYHRGLDLDVRPGKRCALGDAAWELAVNGQVTLFQRRSEAGFDYIAMRVSPKLGEALRPAPLI